MHALIVSLFVALGLGMASTAWALFCLFTPDARRENTFLGLLMKICLVFGLPLLLVSTYSLYGPLNQAFKSSFLFPLGLLFFTMALSQFLFILWETKRLNKFLNITPLLEKSQPSLAQATLKWIGKTFVASIVLGATCFVAILANFLVAIL